LNRRISVIVPTLNEEEFLPHLLVDLMGQIGVDVEIIVADAGSVDQTRELAAMHKLVDAPYPHRARQLNLGAQVATHNWLLFLHADSRLPTSTMLSAALKQLEGTERTAGHFQLRFVGADQDHQGFQYLSRKTALNRANTTNGDQGFLVPRELYLELGGFDETLPFLEDQRFAEKLRRSARWVTLDGYLETSTRRFSVEGFGPRYTLMAVMMGVHDAGIHSFFDAAKPYVSQDQTGPLDLTPFLGVIKDVTGRMPPGERLGAWLAVGKFVRKNAWQLAFFLDVYMLDDPANPVLEFFDQELEHRLDSPFFDALAGALTAALFRVVLPTTLRIKSRGG